MIRVSIDNENADQTKAASWSTILWGDLFLSFKVAIFGSRLLHCNNVNFTAV